MKKNLIFIILTLVVVGFAATLLTRKDNSTIGKQFYITDTSSVSKIYMADMDNHYVELTKSAGHWMVNNEFVAIQESVELLLKTMLRIEIKHLLSKSATQNGLKQLMTKHTKVEIYQVKGLFRIFGKEIFNKERLTKVYYVGSPTQDNKGTLMKMEGEDQLYITHYPGMNGYLSERFSPIQTDWKSHELFNLAVNDIKEIIVEFPETPEQSYIIKNNLDRSFQLIQQSTQKNIEQFDTLKLLSTVAAFGKINYEMALDNLTKTKTDSILNSQVYRKITILRTNGETKTLTMFHRSNYEGTLDLNEEPFPYDVDRMYAFEDSSRDALSVQFFVVDVITRQLKHYAPYLFPVELEKE